MIFLTTHPLSIFECGRICAASVSCSAFQYNREKALCSIGDGQGLKFPSDQNTSGCVTIKLHIKYVASNTQGDAFTIFVPLYPSV